MLKRVGILLCIFNLLVVGSVFAQAPKKGGTLIYGRGGDSVGLDPAYETDGNSFMVSNNVLETLVEFRTNPRRSCRAWQPRGTSARTD